MNRPIPKLGSVKSPSQFSEKFFKGYSHIALPIVNIDSEVAVDELIQLLKDNNAWVDPQ